MSEKVVIRFVPPDALKEKNGSGTVVRVRHWNTDKILAYLQDTLTPGVHTLLKNTAQVEVIEARAADIRFEGFKPAKITEAREAIGDLIGDAMGEIDPEEYLSA